jgi:pyridoxamine 5'-phosphate oxidase
MNPLELFEEWYDNEKQASTLKLPAACCLSTIGLDGYPNSRFVSLKEVSEKGFIITGSFDSRKGKEIEKTPKASLTFWWTETQSQVRIQGDVVKITPREANNYFKERSRAAQIVSVGFQQGKKINSIAYLQNQFDQKIKEFEGKEIDCPKNWSGIIIKPLRIEFMRFKEDRLHERKLYSKVKDTWKISVLQP